jgi:outer membrane protein assembly factor BamB
MEQLDIRNWMISRGVAQLWCYSADRDSKTGHVYVSVSPDGSLIAGASGKTVYVIDQTGTVVWKHRFALDDGWLGDILITAKGTVICTATDLDVLSRVVYVMTPDGKLLYRYIQNPWYDTLTSSMDGTNIAVVSEPMRKRFRLLSENAFILFDGGGKLLWKRKIGGGSCRPSLSYDGSLVAVTSDDRCVSLFTNKGKLLWKYRTRQNVYAVSIAKDGSLIAVGSSKLYALGREGKLLWDFDLGGDAQQVCVCADGSRIAARSEGGKLHLLTSNGKLLWTYPTETTVSYIVSILLDGSLIAASYDPSMLDNEKLKSESPSFEPCSVYMLTSEEKLLWKFKPGGHAPGLSTSSDGTILAVGAENNVLLYRCQTPQSLLEDMKGEIVGMIRNALQQGDLSGKTGNPQ